MPPGAPSGLLSSKAIPKCLCQPSIPAQSPVFPRAGVSIYNKRHPSSKPQSRSQFHTSHSPSSSTSPPNTISEIGINGAAGATNSRWLSLTKTRIGKCILFGMSKAQTQKAASILRVLGEEWRELVAGREGFLTEPRRAGLLRHKVVWGEMDSMVCLYLESSFLCFGEG
jgi:hypothetical protein